MKTWQFDLGGGLKIAAMLVGLVAFTADAAAKAIVVFSSAPGIEARTELKDDRVLDLPAGTEVDLLLPNGSTKRVPGPFNGRVDSLYENRGILDMVYQTVRDIWVKGGRSSGEAASRSVKPFAKTNWRAIQVVKREGNRTLAYCFEKGSRPVLTRGRKMTDVLLRITDTETQTLRAEADWPRGEAKLAWPSAMSLKDGGTYSITNSSAIVNVVLREVPAGSLSGDRVLGTLARHKCLLQLEAWLRQKQRGGN